MIGVTVIINPSALMTLYVRITLYTLLSSVKTFESRAKIINKSEALKNLRGGGGMGLQKNKKIFFLKRFLGAYNFPLLKLSAFLRALS